LEAEGKDIFIAGGPNGAGKTTAATVRPPAPPRSRMSLPGAPQPGAITPPEGRRHPLRSAISNTIG